MNKYTSLSTRFKSILLVFVILFSGLSSTLVLLKPQSVEAASFAPKLNGTAEPNPSSSGEYGIWIDRALIYVYYNSRNNLTDQASHAFSAEVDGLNGGNRDYTSGCRKITVSRANRDIDRPSSGVYKACDGTESNITLVNQDSAFIDGYSYEESGEKTIFMPRYISGVNGCGTLKTNSGIGGLVDFSGKYDKDGTFKEKSSSKYILDGTEARTEIHDYSQGSGDYATAKQKRTSECGAAGEKPLSYAGEGSNGARTIYLLKDFTRNDVQLAAANKINAFQSRKVRAEMLTKFITTDQAGKGALSTCKNKTGIGGSDADLIQLLAETGSNAGVNPFVDCMLDELNGNSSFETAMTYAYDGDFNEDLTADNADGCSGGIPIIGELLCHMVESLFNAVLEAFTGIISWMAQPPDMFKQQNGTLRASMDNLKTIANILFVLAFLMVIFQYLTNINVADAYFIKKFIPRLVIAVVLVQASFWITSELNYFFYDLGSSVQSIVFFGQPTGGIQLGNGASMIALYAATLMPVLLILGIIMLIVLIITFIVLAVRYVLIIVLAIVAPIAFAALAIPQLEGMTKKWFKMYIQLLMMYPIVMFFIAASAVIGQAFSGGNFIIQMMGLIVLILPFIILPFTFKFAGGIMGGVTAKLAKGTKAAVRAPMKGYKSYKKAEGMYEKHTPKGRERATARQIREKAKQDAALRGGTERAITDMQKPLSGGGIRGAIDRYNTFGAINPDSDTVNRNRELVEDGLRRQRVEDSNHRLGQLQHDVPGAVMSGATSGAFGAGDTDAMLKAVASGERVTVTGSDGVQRQFGGDAADAEVAMNQLAGHGRDDALRELRAGSINTEPPGATPVMRTVPVDQAALQRSISSNSSALAGKAQDLVKGDDVYESKGVSSEALTQLSGGSIKKAVRDIHGTGDRAKINTLQSEVQRMVESDTLFDKLTPAAAKDLHNELQAIGGTTDPTVLAKIKSKAGI